MRIKIPKSNKPPDLLNCRLDPETARKLHEARQKIDMYYDDFELSQCMDAINVDEELCCLSQAELDALMKIVETYGIEKANTLRKSELRAFMEKGELNAT